MAVPKKRTSRRRRNMRRAHDFLTAVGSVACSNCGAPALPHHVCPTCGYYKGRAVVAVQDQSQA